MGHSNKEFHRSWLLASTNLFTPLKVGKKTVAVGSECPVHTSCGPRLIPDKVGFLLFFFISEVKLKLLVCTLRADCSGKAA